MDRGESPTGGFLAAYGIERLVKELFEKNMPVDCRGPETDPSMEAGHKNSDCVGDFRVFGRANLTASRLSDSGEDLKISYVFCFHEFRAAWSSRARLKWPNMVGRCVTGH